MKLKLNAFIETKDHDGFKVVTEKTLMWHLTAHQGDVVHCMTPDGPSDDFCYHILLENWFTGSIYRLNTVIYGHIRSETYEDEDCTEDVTWYENARTRAESLIEKIKAKGEVDLDNWTGIR